MLKHQDDIVIIKECCKNLGECLQNVATGIGVSENAIHPSLVRNETDRILQSITSLEKKILRWQHLMNELKAENKQLKLENQDLRLNTTAKARCIDDFKQKLSSQYVQIQYLSSENSRVMETTCQNERNEFFFAGIDNELSGVAEKQEVKYCADNTVISVIGKSESINYEKVEYQNETFYSKRDELERIYSSKLQVMEEENFRLKDQINKMQLDCDGSNKVTAKLEAECLVFKKSFDQSNSVIEVFENIKKQLCDKLVVSLEQKKSKNMKILQLMKDIDKLKEEVLQLKQEREHVDGMALGINKRFGEMKRIQEQMKESLKNKDEIISELEQEKLKMKEEHKRYRSMEFDDKRKIQELLEDLKNLQIQKQEMAAFHYEELCDSNNKLKTLEIKLDEMMETRKILLGKQTVEKEKIIYFLSEIYSIVDSKIEYNIDISSDVSILLKNILRKLKLNQEKDELNKNSKRKFICGFRNRLKQLEEKSKRISAFSFKNFELMKNIYDSDLQDLVGRTKRLWILTEVKQQEKLQLKKRFEKHQHALLVQVKKYRKASQLTEENCSYLQSLCDILRSDLKLAQRKLMEKEDENSSLQLSSLDGDEIDNSRNSKGEMQDAPDHSVGIEKGDYSDEMKVALDPIKHVSSHEIEGKLEIEEGTKEYLSQQFDQKNCLLEEYSNEINLLKNDMKLLQSRFEEKTKLLSRIKAENSHLQEGLRKREELLRKIFITFKQKIQDAIDEANDKYFLQRLCSDLKFALKILLKKNKIIKNSVQNSNELCIMKSFMPETPVKYSENYIQSLLRRQQDTSSLTNSFNDIQSYIDSLKNGMSFLQSAMLKR